MSETSGKPRGIDDAGEELSFKRKGAGKLDKNKRYVTWMTKNDFNKEHPELVPNWQAYRDAGAPYPVASIAHRYYNSLPPLRTPALNFSEDLDEVNDSYPDKQETLNVATEAYQKFLTSFYEAIEQMMQTAIQMSQRFRSQGEDGISGAKYEQLIDEFVRGLRNSKNHPKGLLQDVFRAQMVDAYQTFEDESEDVFTRYSVVKRHRNAMRYYLNKNLNLNDFEQEVPESYWAKIIKPTRTRKAKYDDDVQRPEIAVFSAEYTGDIPIPDIAPDDWAEHMVQTFGLKGMEFGTWNKQTERLKFITECYTGLMELADLLNIEPNQIGMGGRLGLAIGARGRGNAAAHFQPVDEHEGIINLTRKKGVGCLAHEYGHALDFFGIDGNSRYLSGTNAKGNELFLNSIHGYVPQHSAEPFNQKIECLKQTGNETLGCLWKELKDDQSLSDSNKSEIRRLIRELLAYQPKIEKLNGYTQSTDYEYKHKHMIGSDLEAVTDKIRDVIDSGYTTRNATRNAGEIHSLAISIRYSKQDIIEQQWAINSLPLSGTSSESPNRRKGQNSFFSRSYQLDRGRTKKYWSTDKEKWARLFETWVYHRLEDKGITHDALVSGVCGSDYPDGKCPYPTELDGSLPAFNAALDQIILKDKLFSEALVAPESKPTQEQDEEPEYVPVPW